MNGRNLIKIEVNHTNPVEYLACCGIFEIASRFDETTLAHWQVDDSETSFNLETISSEQELLEIIIQAFSDLNNWEAVYVKGKRRNLSHQAKNTEDEVIRLEVVVSNKFGQENKIVFDWWYEVIKEDGKTRNSKWKMYAARQNPEQISERFVNESIKLLKNTEISSLTNLLKTMIKSQSKFGFDPRPCVNALDLGYVPNDIGKGFPTYLYAEMLSVFGAHFFFPTRTAQPRETKSTRSWIQNSINNKREDHFIYSLWLNKCPISLARVLASTGNVLTNKSVAFNSVKDRRGEYLGNLKFSTLGSTKNEILDR
jgi:CRISPR-associated protein Csb3